VFVECPVLIFSLEAIARLKWPDLLHCHRSLINRERHVMADRGPTPGAYKKNSLTGGSRPNPDVEIFLL
jgi:hypothetical protein